MNIQDDNFVKGVAPLPAILRMHSVIRKVGLSRASIYRLMHGGEFPKQFKIGTSAVGWLLADIDAWIAARSRARAPESPSCLQA